MNASGVFQTQPAKFMSATARHVIASAILFNTNFAFGTIFMITFLLGSLINDSALQLVRRLSTAKTKLGETTTTRDGKRMTIPITEAMVST
jgi:hypothetical protein